MIVLSSPNRFIYIDSNALKLEKPVEFPLSGLDMTPFLSGPFLPPPPSAATVVPESDRRPLFDLYATVNHYGSVGGGHYTAFCRHMPSSQWNYFDDCCVSENKVPGDQVGDQSSAYVLFFQRRGEENLGNYMYCTYHRSKVYREIYLSRYLLRNMKKGTYVS